eukprot:m.200298 g.200298  ORF g.200298 m.200298 type:complete len:610 (-) comp17692_c1_seq7:2847-4676(-)
MASAAAKPDADLMEKVKSQLRADKIQLWQKPYTDGTGGHIPQELVDRYSGIVQADAPAVKQCLEYLRDKASARAAKSKAEKAGEATGDHAADSNAATPVTAAPLAHGSTSSLAVPATGSAASSAPTSPARQGPPPVSPKPARSSLSNTNAAAAAAAATPAAAAETDADDKDKEKEKDKEKDKDKGFDLGEEGAAKMPTPAARPSPAARAAAARPKARPVTVHGTTTAESSVDEEAILELAEEQEKAVKLQHLTATRPKANKRPPTRDKLRQVRQSMITTKTNEESFDDMPPAKEEPTPAPRARPRGAVLAGVDESSSETDAVAASSTPPTRKAPVPDSGVRQSMAAAASLIAAAASAKKSGAGTPVAAPRGAGDTASPLAATRSVKTSASPPKAVEAAGSPKDAPPTRPVPTPKTQRASDHQASGKLVEMLAEIGLSQHLDALVNGGFEDVKFLADVTGEDLSAVGITDTSHQQKIIAAVKKATSTPTAAARPQPSVRKGVAAVPLAAAGPAKPAAAARPKSEETPSTPTTPSTPLSAEERKAQRHAVRDVLRAEAVQLWLEPYTAADGSSIIADSFIAHICEKTGLTKAAAAEALEELRQSSLKKTQS